jgi:SAM-dependent methyltransferase
MGEIKKPIDWNDHDGWERYYSELYVSGDYDYESRHAGSIGGHIPEFTADLKAKNWRNIWVAGCGLSILPRLLAGHGFEVHATDISHTAVEFQEREGIVRSDQPGAEDSSKTSPGSLLCKVHDFRQPYLTDYFDVILNVKAIQAFDRTTMEAVARAHYHALRPGGRAYFDTLNVQGERRDVLEKALVDAGFLIPFYDLESWYRRALRDTGIHHVFILGMPVVPGSGDENAEQRERDRDVLRSITLEYRARMEAEAEAERQRMSTEGIRTAIVIYSTG